MLTSRNSLVVGKLYSTHFRFVPFYLEQLQHGKAKSAMDCEIVVDFNWKRHRKHSTGMLMFGFEESFLLFNCVSWVHIRDNP